MRKELDDIRNKVESKTIEEINGEKIIPEDKVTNQLHVGVPTEGSAIKKVEKINQIEEKLGKKGKQAQ